MSITDIIFHPIGVINSPHKKLSETPIQPVYSKGIKGSVTIDTSYSEGIMDLEGFFHICLLYFFHKSQGMKLVVKPYLEVGEHGIFATRAPSRLNPLGLSLVKLISIRENVLFIEDMEHLSLTLNPISNEVTQGKMSVQVGKIVLRMKWRGFEVAGVTRFNHNVVDWEYGHKTLDPLKVTKASLRSLKN